MKKLKRFKRGATSFYIVAFSTLILVIIAASFATVMISEVTRSSNDDLSQSAYDAALAGVEDAKLAYANYQRCMSTNKSYITNPPTSTDGSDSVNCQNIVYWMNHGDCDMVAKMLGRGHEGEQGVFITETTGNSGISMQQYYTCVKMATILDDYRANLTMDNNARVVKVQFANSKTAKDVASVKLSWYMINETETTNFSNLQTLANGAPSRVAFYPADERRPATPPSIVMQLIQTADQFSLGGSRSTPDASSYSSMGDRGINVSEMGLNGISQGEATDRATMFFTPAGCNGGGCDDNMVKEFASKTVSGNYKGVYDATRGSDGENYLRKADVAATNNQYGTNEPFAVYCNEKSADFACSVRVQLPDPVTGGGDNAGGRNDDTFMFLVTLPYGEPDTDFSLQFYDNAGNVLQIADTQVTIDSTGRANDLYRRVETRLEPTDTAFPYIYYVMELFGDGAEPTLKKNMIVKCENNFYDHGTNVTFVGGQANGYWAPLAGRNCS